MQEQEVALKITKRELANAQVAETSTQGMELRQGQHELAAGDDKNEDYLQVVDTDESFEVQQQRRRQE